MVVRYNIVSNVLVWFDVLFVSLLYCKNFRKVLDVNIGSESVDVSSPIFGTLGSTRLVKVDVGLYVLFQTILELLAQLITQVCKVLRLALS